MNISNPTIEKYMLIYNLSKKKERFSDIEIGAKLRKIDEKSQGPKFKKFIKVLSLGSLLIAPFIISKES